MSKKGTVAVRMLTTVAGASVDYQAGKVYELSSDLARAFCEEPASEPRATYVEREAISPPRERAVRKASV